MLSITRKDKQEPTLSWRDTNLVTVTHKTWSKFQATNGNIDLSTEQALDRLAIAIVNDTAAFVNLALAIRANHEEEKEV